MEKVARQSGGSFQATAPAASEKASSVSISRVQCCRTVNKDPCGSLLPRCPVSHFPVCAWNPDSPCMPSVSSAKWNFIDSSPEVSSFMRGARVLARREADGYYYLGHIAQEVKGSREHFLIEFDKSRPLKGKVQLRMQETPLYDILHYEDARQQPLAPGDSVLAPWEDKAERFGPGTVLKVMENKEAHLVCTAHNRRGVLVNFWNGQTKEVTSDQALRIPLPLSERITLELQMPSAARQMVVDSSLDYPYIVTPGYRASGHYRQGHSDLDYWPRGLYSTQPCAKCSCRCTSLPRSCLAAQAPTRPAGCKVQQEDTFIPGTSLAKEELSKKIEEQLSEVRISFSESVSREEQKKEDKRLKTENVPKGVQSYLEEDNEAVEPKKSPQREMAHAMVDAAVNTDSWLKETVHKEEAGSRQQDAETEANVKHQHGLFKSRVAEAPIQHSQRSPSLGTSALVPFRRQSFFDQVNQSLEKDSLTIRSALRVQRPHSTSNAQARRSTNFLSLLKDKSITKSILNGTSQARWREMDFNRAKTEHKRGQEEQRQLKREQQQEAGGTRCQLCGDNQRQQLRQRTLQGPEKQLEHKDRALQHMGLLQAAEAERSRRESFMPEREKRKASQRRQFLKAQRPLREELQAERNERSFEQEKKRLDFLRSRMQAWQEMLEQESQEQDRRQIQQKAARVLQSKDCSRQKVEKEGQKLCDLQQYLREQNLLMLRASLLAKGRCRAGRVPGLNKKTFCSP
ncbi:trichohyalin-like [Phalacrocorax carbo]|uniref:trichohyalin-like n=1 Tax=Phalacrocorax carbo TaxID=9209 RepID=UPI0031191E84